MMRVKDLPKDAIKDEHQLVADFFGLTIAEVAPEPQPDAFSIFIPTNEHAQEQYKICNPYGNVKNIPNQYDFSKRILVIWNGRKVQPA